MKLPIPSLSEVEACDANADTLKLLRWRTFCPLPETLEEQGVAELILAKLESADKKHREAIESAVGYAARKA